MNENIKKANEFIKNLKKNRNIIISTITDSNQQMFFVKYVNDVGEIISKEFSLQGN